METLVTSTRGTSDLICPDFWSARRRLLFVKRKIRDVLWDKTQKHVRTKDPKHSKIAPTCKSSSSHFLQWKHVILPSLSKHTYVNTHINNEFRKLHVCVIWNFASMSVTLWLCVHRCTRMEAGFWVSSTFLPLHPLRKGLSENWTSLFQLGFTLRCGVISNHTTASFFFFPCGSLGFELGSSRLQSRGF